MTDEQKVITMLAQSLLAHSEDFIEEIDPNEGAFVHGAECGGYCEWACGAVWIGYTTNTEGEKTITEVANAGTLKVTL